MVRRPTGPARTTRAGGYFRATSSFDKLRMRVEPAAYQWRKWRTPVKTIATLCSLAASITS
ncbi:hypothetical protein GGD54_004981 [Rhizobium tropici]|uniref:Transposase n=1 Tax=Rhizobium tropici TaxID=398 RepID=A0ABR6R606_RHITR|nr:hypothetical protein [Rhizobium tropici]MBB5595317.1 hypothetical protein [Rhizobium tropici]MBB6494613.1 hypothetical protein [Rhizobium tropici]